MAGESLDDTASKLTTLSWINVVDVGQVPAAIAAWDLDAGETAVLTWATQQEGWTAVLDDGAARDCAIALGIPVLGTLGVIIRSKRQGIIPDARTLVDELFRRGIYLDRQIAEEALRLVGE